MSYARSVLGGYGSATVVVRLPSDYCTSSCVEKVYLIAFPSRQTILLRNIGPLTYGVQVPPGEYNAWVDEHEIPRGYFHHFSSGPFAIQSGEIRVFDRAQMGEVVV